MNTTLKGKSIKKKGKNPFTVNIKVPKISGSQKDNNREGTKSVFHHIQDVPGGMDKISGECSLC